MKFIDVKLSWAKPLACALSFVFVSINAASAQETLSDLEQRIVTAVDASLPSAVDDLKAAVNINSGTMNFAGVRQVGDLFAERLQELGLKTEWVDGTGFERAGHLLATHHSTNEAAPKLLLIGHLDTVFAKDDEFQSYREVSPGFVAGPGITDMKGGDVIIIYALKALKEAGGLSDLNLKVVMTGDEERSGKPLSRSKQALIEAAQWADVALGFEDGDSNIKTAVIARRGSISWRLNVTAGSAHSSQIFQQGVGFGAAFEVARILNEFRVRLAGKGDLTFNPGLMVVGTDTEFESTSASGSAFGKNNVIAKTATVTGDIRALNQQELDQAKQVMQDIVAANLPETSATLLFFEGYPPLAPTDENRALLLRYSEVSEALGFGQVVAVNPRNAGAADISFTAGHVNMALDGLGLMGSGGHTKDEVADMSSLHKNIKKAAILMHRLAN